jgi:hypothetical protein
MRESGGYPQGQGTDFRACSYLPRGQGEPVGASILTGTKMAFLYLRLERRPVHLGLFKRAFSAYSGAAQKGLLQPEMALPLTPTEPRRT